MSLFLRKKTYDFIFDNKKNMRTNQSLRILHFGRSSKFHCMETM